VKTVSLQANSYLGTVCEQQVEVQPESTAQDRKQSQPVTVAPVADAAHQTQARYLSGVPDQQAEEHHHYNIQGHVAAWIPN
jgi:hypothetical protein